MSARWWVRLPMGGWYGPYATKRLAVGDLDATHPGGPAPVKRAAPGAYIYGVSTELIRQDVLGHEPEAAAGRVLRARR